LVTSIRRRNFSLPSLIRRRHDELANDSYSMHENLVYKNILKTLYTINNKERARKSCLLNPNLLHLYSDPVKTSDSEEGFRALVEVIKAVRKDYKKHALKSKKDRNPYERIKYKLYEIYDITRKTENRKYTLFFSDSSGFKELINQYISQGLNDNDEVIGNEKESTENEVFECDSKVKEYYNPSNLEQGIE
jgi:hypothetical protein